MKTIGAIRINVCFTLSLTALIFFPGMAVAENPRLDPAKTHAVIVGVLEWENRSITSYAKENRKDLELYETLAKMGVPKDNMTVLLDEKATLKEIRKVLRDVAAGAAAGDTFIFYYAGHGTPGRDGVNFLNYDSTKSGAFPVSEIADILKEEFEGERVLMFADCCFSGGLAKTAETLAESGFKAASITSAAETNLSTNNWTFTQILIDTLRGGAAADRDGDKVITIAEAGMEVADAMKFYEFQQHGQSRFKVSEDLVLCDSSAKRSKGDTSEPYMRFEYVHVEANGRWSPARIVDIRDAVYSAEIQNYSTRKLVEVGKDKVRKFPPVTFRRAVRVAAAKPEKILGEKEALEKAQVGGKYTTLLKKVEVESDYRLYSEFRDYGHFPATDYGVYTDLPAGYWVYVYPNWYIWKSVAE